MAELRSHCDGCTRSASRWPTVVVPALSVFAPPMPAWTVGHSVLAAVAVALLAMAGWSVWRQRRGGAAPEGPSTASESVDKSGAESADTASAVPVDRPPSRPSAAAEAVRDSEQLFLASDSDSSARRCTECERSFPAAFDVCPFDDTALKAAESEASEPLGPAAAKRTCTDCGRRYESGARYCFFDGNRLHSGRAPTDEATAFVVCRHCGWHSSKEDHHECPRDGHRLVTLEPRRQQQAVIPPFPFNRCRHCGHLAPTHQTRCPNDDTELFPATAIRPRALPVTGFGIRRRICPDCGTRFDDQCRYCSLDGTRLVELN